MTPPGHPSPIADLSAALAEAVAALAPSLVTVEGRRSRLSGFLWRPGLVVTAEENLDEGDFAVTLAGGERGEAELAGRDPSTDIALFRIADKTRPAADLSEDIPPTGALALAAGAAGGAPLAALGLVARSGPGWLSMRGGRIDARVELDLDPGRSLEGGLALLPGGAPFGMIVRGPRRRGLVIPAATILRVATTLAERGRVARGYLGLGLQPVAIDGQRKAAAMVMTVDPDGPGAAAGILQGDIVTGRDGTPMGSLRDLVRSLGPESVGTPVTLEMRRAGEPRSVVVTVGERREA